MKLIAPKIINALFVALVLILTIKPANAQSTEDQASEALAVEHFDNGARLFYEGDFSSAIIEFRKAYDYNPDPMILYNISLAHERLGNIPEALRIGQTAAQNPTLPAPVGLRNDARLAAFTIAITSEKITTRTAAAARNAALAAGLQPGSTAPEDAPPIWSRLTPVGWSGAAVASVGLVLLTYAGIVNYGLSADIARYETTTDRLEYNRLKADITTQSRQGRTSLYTGAALAVIGAGLLSFDLLYDRSPNTDTSPDTESDSSPNDLLLSQKVTLKIGFLPSGTESLVQFSGTF